MIRVGCDRVGVDVRGGGLVRGIGRSTVWESGLRCRSGRRLSEG